MGGAGGGWVHIYVPASSACRQLCVCDPAADSALIHSMESSVGHDEAASPQHHSILKSNESWKHLF
jgi:hypothetical protein